MNRILVVDDEPSILAAMVPLLQSTGYDVVTATTGYSALESVARRPPHLVIPWCCSTCWWRPSNHTTVRRATLWGCGRTR